MTLLQTPAASTPAPAATQRWFRARDGAELYYRAWLPAEPARRAMLLLHRGHEHSGRWEQFVQDLALPRTALFAWDARGHGRSSGERGYAEHLSTFTQDLDSFARHVCGEYDISIEKTAIVAHSVGAVIAAAWVHDFAPPICAMVLATPALDVKLYVPFALPLLKMGWAAGLIRFVKSYVKPGMLTDDPDEALRYAQDPLISRQIAVNVLLELRQTSQRLIDDAGAMAERDARGQHPADPHA